MPDESQTVISTWFVSDDEANTTFFPQIGMTSNTPEAKAIYWRCVLCFFASSIVVNPHASHVFFTNAKLPIIDGVIVSKAFEQWRVNVVELPISYRLPPGSVNVWGNQFYIFDIISHLAKSGQHARYIVLDSDCVWMRPVTALETSISKYGVLTYLLDETEYKAAQSINGLSRQGMACFLSSFGGEPRETLPYCGGEIFAATLAEIDRLAKEVDKFWPHVLAGEEDSPKEEAHLLSVLYAKNGYEVGTANSFIRRMWTTFKHNDVTAADFDLTIWHLPSEKKSGFRNLFAKLAAANGDYRNPAALGFRPELYGTAMGVPRRNMIKLAQDLAAKLGESLFRVKAFQSLKRALSTRLSTGQRGIG